MAVALAGSAGSPVPQAMTQQVHLRCIDRAPSCCRSAADHLRHRLAYRVIAKHVQREAALAPPGAGAAARTRGRASTARARRRRLPGCCSSASCPSRSAVACARGCAARAAAPRLPRSGASVSGSAAVCVFGNAITSRMLSAPAISIASRSSPKAMPPCGGQPKRSASSRKPNFEPRLLGADAEQREHGRLHLLAEDSHRAAADLRAVEHHVVGARQRAARMPRAAPPDRRSAAR